MVRLSASPQSGYDKGAYLIDITQQAQRTGREREKKKRGACKTRKGNKESRGAARLTHPCISLGATSATQEEHIHAAALF